MDNWKKCIVFMKKSTIIYIIYNIYMCTHTGGVFVCCDVMKEEDREIRFNLCPCSLLIFL